MKNNIKILLLWSLSIAIMVIVFLFSSQNSDDSSALSLALNGRLAGLLEFFGLKRLAQSEELHNFIRKCAHAFLYCSLGLSVVVSARNSFPTKYGLWAILICFAYAISDELHQAFVPGRGPMVADVLLDTASAAVGMGIYLLVGLMMLRQKAKNRMD